MRKIEIIKKREKSWILMWCR